MAGAAAFALVPFAFRASPLSASVVAPLAYPAGPMMFTRRLERQLGEHNVLSVERTFLIAFESGRTGRTRIVGQQSSVVVTAPEGLAPLAKLEEQRVEGSLFPMELDGSGFIIKTPDARPPASLADAVAIAEKRIAGSPLAATEKADARSFVRSLATIPVVVGQAPPADLFVPPATPSMETRELDVGGGMRGRVDVEFGGDRDPVNQVMSTAYRRIETHIGKSSRGTLEEWSLAPSSAR